MRSIQDIMPVDKLARETAPYISETVTFWADSDQKWGTTRNQAATKNF